MIVLVTGGAASGKSAVAERVALALPAPHTYAAAMRNEGEEAAFRIERHRMLRAGLGFETCELTCGDRIARNGTVLLEDLGNLVANGLEDSLPCVLTCDNAVVVTNEIGSDGVQYDRFTSDFIERLGALSCMVAARSDVVVEVVAGMPNVVKGELTWIS